MTDVQPGAMPADGDNNPGATPQNAPTSTVPTDDGGYPEGLGDPGKKALDAMKAERNEAKRIAAEAKRRAEELENELASLRNGGSSKEDTNVSDTESLIAAAIENAKAEVKAEYAQREKELKFSAAAARAGVPEELLPTLKVESFYGEDGSLNEELLSKFGGPKRPQAQASARELGIGAQSNSNSGQLTREDMKRMSPAEIVKARQDGRLDALMKGQL